MHQQFDHVRLSAHRKVAVIALDHAVTVNALSSATMRGLNGALDAAQGGDFRAIVLTGEGRGFSSGADMSEMPERQAEGAGATLERHYHPFLRRLRDCPLPLVTAVNGPAVGIGMSLALMGDLTIAARSAYFQLAFTHIGLVPDGGATWLLPRLIGLARAREMAFLAERVSAEQALAWGLVNRVTDDARLRDEAVALAQRLADGPAALPMTRRLFWDSPQNTYEAQLAREGAAQEQAGRTQDFREGLAAFQQKRPPVFRGK